MFNYKSFLYKRLTKGKEFGLNLLVKLVEPAKDKLTILIVSINLLVNRQVFKRIKQKVMALNKSVSSDLFSAILQFCDYFFRPKFLEIPNPAPLPNAKWKADVASDTPSYF